MLMILQKFGQCPLVFTLFGNRSDYELLDVSLKSWKKKTTFCVISAWRRTKMHVLDLYGFFFWIDWPKVKDSWRKHFDACKSLATFVKCYVDRTTLSCPQIYIYIYPLLRWGHLWRRNSFCDFGSPYVSAMLLLCFFVASFHHREEKRLTLDHKSYINVQVSPGGHEFRRQCFECSKKFDFISKCWPLQL